MQHVLIPHLDEVDSPSLPHRSALQTSKGLLNQGLAAQFPKPFEEFCLHISLLGCEVEHGVNAKTAATLTQPRIQLWLCSARLH